MRELSGGPKGRDGVFVSEHFELPAGTVDDMLTRYSAMTGEPDGTAGALAAHRAISFVGNCRFAPGVVMEHYPVWHKSACFTDVPLIYGPWGGAAESLPLVAQIISASVNLGPSLHTFASSVGEDLK